MQVICCKCGRGYKAKFFQAEGISNPFIECPHCGYQHTIDFIPIPKHSDNKKKEIRKIKLGGGPSYADLGGTRILSIDAVTDHSGVDDGNVTNWTKTNEFIVAVCIHSSGKDTESSTYKLQWQDDNDGGGYVDLASDSGSPELSFTIGDTSWNNGDAVATGDQVCDIQGGDTRQAGERIKNTSLSDAIDLPDEYQSELWFGVDSDNSDDGHVYSFQVYSVVEGAALGVCGATLAIAAGSTIYYQNVGQGAVAIVGNLSTKTKFFKTVGGHAMNIAGSLSTKLRFSKAVGGHAMTITGTLSTVTKYRKSVGGYAMNIVGSLRKKISKNVGGYSMTITGGLKKKTSKTVGGYAMVIVGSLSTRLRFKQNTGGGIVNIIGTLLTQFIQGTGDIANMVVDVVRDVVRDVVKKVLK